MEASKKFFAFISYKKEDYWWAHWLQQKLEHYRLPASLRRERADLPARVAPVFEYRSEMSGGVLPDELKKALDDSRWLIVICSRRTPASSYVTQEVQYFLDAGLKDRIIPFIIDTEAQNPVAECFPEVLRPYDLRGIHINENGRDAAAVKTVAQMFSLSFDTLWQRYERYKRRRRTLVIAGISLLTATFLAFGLLMQQKNAQLHQSNWTMMQNQARAVAEKARQLVDDGDSYLARRLLLEVLPKDSTDQSRPYVPEAESALRYAMQHDNAILRGDGPYLYSAAFSHDGKQIIATGESDIINIWDALSGQKQKTLFADDYGNLYAEFSNDNKLIATSSTGGTITLWDNLSGNKIWSSDYLGDHVTSVSFSSDGKRLVSSSNSGSIIVWNTETGDQILTIDEQIDKVKSATFSPNDHHILSASWNTLATIWDTQTGKEIMNLKGHSGVLNFTAYNPNGTQIVTASGDSTVKIWNASSGNIIHTLRGHKGEVFCSRFSPDGRQIVTASADSTIKIWDAKTGNLVHNLIGHHDEVHSVAFNSTGKHIVSSSFDGTVRIWENDSIIHYRTLEGHLEGVIPVAFNPSGTKVASSGDSTIIIWDAINGNKIKTLYGHTDGVNCVTFSPDGQNIASASFDNTIKIWDAQSGTEKKTLIGHFDWVKSVMFSPDGKYLTSGSYDYTIKIWDTRTWECINTLKHFTMGGLSPTYNADGSMIVSRINDSTSIIKIWNAPNGTELTTLNVPNYIVGWCTTVFSPNNKYVIFSSSDRTIKIIDIETAKIITTLRGHNGDINAIDISRDGKQIVSASDDKTIIIWDVENGTKIFTIEGHKDCVHSVKFSPDGKKIVSASADGTIRIWDWPSLWDLIDSTRTRFGNRELTAEEKRQYYLE